MHLPEQDPAGLPDTPYLAGAGAPIDAPSLAGSDHEPLDVVVIGGGMMGMSLALHAAEAGARVALLEAKKVGWGAAGRNSGHVPPATKLEPAEIIRRYGTERGTRLLRAVGNGPEWLFGLAARLGIEANARQTGGISAAVTQAAYDRLRKRAEFWAAHGAELATLDRSDAASVIGSEHYVGCSVDPRGGTINPLALLRGLARAAEAAGVRIYEDSEVTACQREGTSWRVSTTRGSLKADQVALCTNAYTARLFPVLRGSFIPVKAYQFLTEPLAAADTILPGRQGVTDSRRLMSGYRMLDNGAMLFSGLGTPSGRDSSPDLDYSISRMNMLFPQIAGFRLERWWTGWIAANRENAWKLHKLGPGLVSAIGCNGRGLVIAALLGRDIAEYFRGKPETELLLPFSPVERIPFAGLHPVFLPPLIAYYRLRDAIDDRVHRANERVATDRG